jgi:hypothetical protein
LPQAPQLALSVLSFAQYPAPPSTGQCVSLAPQLVVHVPPEHTRPAPHTLPQAPQLALSVPSFAQYDAPPSTVQRVPPCWHLVVQLPPEHTSPAPHVLPHPPQFALSVAVLAHTLPASHQVWPAAHWLVHAPATQIWPVAHALLHVPQLAGSTLVWTQL